MNFECSGNMAIESEELSTKKPNQGFSFIEIMIVIVIMAGIIAIVGPTLFSKLDEAKIDQAKIQMKSLSATPLSNDPSIHFKGFLFHCHHNILWQ